MPQRAIIVGDFGAETSIVEAVLERHADLETFRFESAPDALIAAPTLDPDVFVVGHSERGLDGPAFAESVRAGARFERTPILVVANDGGADLHDRALRSGVDNVLRRPVDPRGLAQRLTSLLAFEAQRKRAEGAQLEVRRHAERLETLRRIGSNAGLADAEYMVALLDAAALVLRDGHPFLAAIVRLEGGAFVVEAAIGNAAAKGLTPGQHFPVDELFSAQVLHAGRTLSWRDALTEDAPVHESAALRSVGRAYVGTPFRVGPTVYVLGMASEKPLTEPLGPLDHAYVETLASLCATRLHQRVQFDRLRYQSEHDTLTGLLNRVSFRALGTAALQRSEPFALAVLDIDAFRSINEAVGQQSADALLVEVGAMLKSLADGDEVARLTADDFAIRMRGVADAEHAERRLLRYLQPFDRPFTTGTFTGVRSVRLTASIGLALAPEHGAHIDQLLTRAYEALDAAKSLGRARWSLFDPQGREAREGMDRLQHELVSALVHDELVLHFQPCIDLRSGRVAGVEALVRWQHPQRGLLFPDAFVPFAEDRAVMGPIGAWVVRETIRLSQAWRRAQPGFRAWFNLSAPELQGSALATLLSSGESLSGLGVEITERTVLRDVDRTRKALHELRGAGLAIALDDFGVGYSSLAQLKRLPIDYVKLDRSFVAGIPGDPHDEAIVEGVLGIGRRFGFGVVAEGVETAEQAAWLTAVGCDHAQGFHFARPMPADALDAWLRRRPASDAPH